MLKCSSKVSLLKFEGGMFLNVYLEKFFTSTYVLKFEEVQEHFSYVLENTKKS
jgi:hypothetical protein